MKQWISDRLVRIAIWAALALIVLMLLADAAFAWCTNPPPPPPYSTAPVVMQKFSGGYTCMPPLFGLTGGRGFLDRVYGPVAGATRMDGYCYGWWCKASDGTWVAQQHCTLEKYHPLTLLGGAIEDAQSKDPLGGMQQLSDQYAVTPTDPSEIHDYNCLHYLLGQDLLATKPVAAGPTYLATGGALYQVVNGAVGPIAQGTPIATKGAPVDCASLHLKKTIVGIVTDYCPLAATPTVPLNTSRVTASKANP